MGWKELGMTAAGTGIDVFSNLIAGQINDRRQIEQQKKLNELTNIQYKQQSDYAAQKQMELWEKTGYVPTVDQMKRAGLNPALMYKGTGAGGSTAAIMGSGSGPSAPNAPVEAPSTGMGMQLALLQAQKENIEADTANKKAITTKTTGVDTEQTQAQTGLTQQLKDNAAIQKELIEQQSEQAQVETHIKTMTMNMVVAQAQYQTSSMWEVLQQQVMQNKITRETADTQIQIIKQQKVNMVVQKAAMEQGIEVDKAAITKMTQDIAQGWEKLSQSEKIMKVNAIIQEVGQKYQGFWGSKGLPHDAGKIAEQIDKIMNVGRENFKK